MGRRFWLAGLLAAATTGPAAGQSFWDPNVRNGTWSNGANWVGGVAPTSGPATTLVFTGHFLDYGAANDLADPFLLTRLEFQYGQGGTFAVTGGQLRFTTASGTGNALLVQNGTGTGLISADVDAARPIQIDRGAAGVGGNVVITGRLTGGGGVVNNYAGQTFLRGGATSLGQLTLLRGTTTIDAGGTFAVAGQFVVANNFSGVTAAAVVTGAGNALTVNGGAFVGRIGGGVGTLDVLGGAGVSTTNQLSIGTLASADGRVRVAGAGTTLSVTGSVTSVGTDGTGRLAVEAGAAATLTRAVEVGDNASGVGTLVIDAGAVTAATAPAAAVSIGLAGPGTLEVRNGGRLLVGNAANTGLNANVLAFAAAAGSTGTGTVTGAGSEASTYSLLMNANGTLTVSAGGAFRALNTANIGQNAGTGTAAVVADGAGSTFNLTGNGTTGQLAQAQVGMANGATGSLTVRNGATATIGTTVGAGSAVVVARDAGSAGAVTVTGAGSALSTPNLQVGGVNGAAGGTAAVTVSDNGTLTVPDTVAVYAGGTLTATTGGTVRVGTAAGAAGAVGVTANGRLGGTGAVQGSLVVAPGGLVSPGVNNTGTLTVTGPVTFQAPAGTARSRYGWEIAAAGASSAVPGGSGGTKDLLRVRTGAVTLDGAAVQVVERPGFAATFDPARPYSWVLMQADPGQPLAATAPALEVAGGSALASAVGAGGQLSLGTFADADGRYLALTYTPVPEPAGVLAAGGLAAAAAGAWRRAAGVSGRPT